MAIRRKNWTRFDDERLLDVRMCDLGLKIERTPLARRVQRLYEELGARDIRLRPHVWLSNEWFSPDGVPGIAIPFYLAHPRLKRLEHAQMLEVEGGSEVECRRVLRHEAGHAIDTAFRLHRRKRWRETFGNYTDPYPTFYRPKPKSRNYVVHLKAWYAQAHPAEDFAETFAVWLAPRSRWRTRYRDWPTALRKLEFVDELMCEIAGTTPPVRSRSRTDPLGKITTTLREHYEEKRKHYGAEWPDFYDRDLARLFSGDARYADRPTAVSFLRGLRREIRERVALWTGAHAYAVDQVLQDIIERCREKKLRLALSSQRAKTEAVLLVTVHTMRSMHWTHREIPL
jgi:hypothetical protein